MSSSHCQRLNTRLPAIAIARRRRVRVIVGLALCVAGAMNIPLSGAADQPITIEDLARFATIGNPQSLDWRGQYSLAPDVGALSPNGEHVAIVLRRGDPETGTNKGTLLLFPTADLLVRPTADPVVEFSSTNNYEPVALVRWLDDSSRIVFAGTDGNRGSQVHEFDVRTRQVRPLTKEAGQLLWFDITPSGNVLVTATRTEPVRPDQDPDCRKQGCRVKAESLYLAERGTRAWSADITFFDLHAGKRMQMAQVESIDQGIERCSDELSGGISPDGRFGFRVCYMKPRQWPGWWTEYSVDQVGRSVERGNNLHGRQLILLDFKKGIVRRLTEAPWLYHQPAPVWIDGGRKAILAGALEPLNDVPEKARAARARTQSILEVDLASGEAKNIAPLDETVSRVSRATWDQSTQTLIVEPVDSVKAPLPAVTFARRAGKWIRSVTRNIAHRPQHAPLLSIEQKLDKPPVLVAASTDERTKKVVYDPNPWLAQRELGRVDAITWSVKSDLRWNGGLYYPIGYAAGKRYPLVIQTHGFRKDQFSLDGYARNFAGRALAAHGMFVLQVAESFGERGKLIVGTPEEWTTVQAGYEAAIDHLSQRGLVDPARVGIQGWSRTGPHVGYAITHSSYPFAAGAFTSTADLGWWLYIAHGAPRSRDTDYGAPPFGAGLGNWQKFAPSFNLDRVRTPMFMWTDGPIWGLWDWYAGLRRLGNPVEYWHLPAGDHDVFTVPQRIKMGVLLVDWFRFWLKDEEDPSPEKIEQYARWRDFRQQQQRQNDKSDASILQSAALASTEDIDRIRKHFAVRTILVGHTKVPTVTPLYDSKVIAVQVYPNRDETTGAAVMEAVLLKGGTWYRAGIDGAREALGAAHHPVPKAKAKNDRTADPDL